MMPSWAYRRILPKLIVGLLGGGALGVSFVATASIDPSQWVMYIVEAVLLTVAILLLAIPHLPQAPNLNPIPIIH
jgi:hypothetical protein